MKTIHYHTRVLSSLINQTSFRSLIFSTLSPEDFNETSERMLFTTLRDAHAQGIKLSFLWLSDEHPELDITPYTKAPYTEDHIKTYCSIITEETTKRRMSALAKTMQDLAQKRDPSSEDLIHQFTRELFSLGQTNRTESTQTLSDLIPRMEEDQKKFKNKKLFGLSTGFPILDMVTKGMEQQTLWALGGYTSFGKSWFMLQFALASMQAGAKTAYISLEMDAKRLAWRIASLQTHVGEDVMMFGNTTPAEDMQIDLIWQGLKDEKNLYLVDGLSTLDDVIFKIMELREIGVTHFFVDYVQNIQVPKKEEYEALTEMMRSFQRLTITKDLFLCVASQMNRESLKGGKAIGFRGSSQIENSVDCAILLEKDESLDTTYLNIIKNRNGFTKKITYTTKFGQGIIEEKI